MNLDEHNLKLYNEYNNLNNKEELSMPLLVSTNNDYLNNLKQKILYIGQETNTWLNSDNSNYTIDQIENSYYQFLKNDCTNKEFWRFLRQIISNKPIIENTIWTNALITSKKNGKGTPNYSKQLIDLSLENIIYLYKYFQPELTIIVSGPTNPYYSVITNFLEEINSKLKGLYPTTNNTLIKDIDKKVFYTYHPNYLQRKNMLKNISSDIKKYTK